MDFNSIFQILASKGYTYLTGNNNHGGLEINYSTLYGNKGDSVQLQIGWEIDKDFVKVITNIDNNINEVFLLQPKLYSYLDKTL